MRGVLLDTHILLWARLDPNRLPSVQKSIVIDQNTKKFISTISIWEISLKFALGKLELGGHTPEEFLNSALKLGYEVTTPEPNQYASFHRLPAISGHKDPFDRMLIWQAMQNKLALLSHDRKLSNYKIHGLMLVS